MTRFLRTARFLTLTALVGVAAACGEDGTLTEPGLRPQAAIDDPNDAFAPEDNTKAFVCVVSPVGGVYSYDITAVTGASGSAPTVHLDPANVGPGACVHVATAGAGANFGNPNLITAAEISNPGGVVFDRAVVEDARYNAQAGNILLGVDVTDPANPATGQIANERATRITFYYDVAPPPPGGEGCTPGYWKQSHHFDSWVGYTPGQAFSSVFEDAFPGMSLLQVVSQGGGGLKALGRHTVAALLNAANPNVASGLTTADVINAFNAVFPGGDYEGLKDVFEALNEQGCPLN